MKQECAICHRPLMGMTLCDGTESYHPDCYKETPKGKEMERDFQEWLKNHKQGIYDHNRQGKHN
jgi:hypothetical protein